MTIWLGLRRIGEFARRRARCCVLGEALLLAMACACAPSGPAPDSAGTETATTTSLTDTGEDPGGPGSRCESSQSCTEGLRCIGLADPKLEVRPSAGVCAQLCVSDLHAELRCLDDAGCCQGLCSAAGVCEAARSATATAQPQLRVMPAPP